MPKVLHVVTNIDRYPDGTPTGLWLSELVHVYDDLEEAGVEQLIASPAGGAVPIEPRSLLPVVCDAATRARHEDPFFMSLLEHSAALAELDAADFDAIYLTGGHGVMVDFPASEDLARLIAQIDRKGGVVAAVCHGPAGLLGARAEDGLPFVHGREVTGFSWREEVVAGVSQHVPFSLEDELRELGAEYGRSPVPMAPHVVVDGRLVTGQNPTSAKGVAKRILELLGAAAPATPGSAIGLLDSARRPSPAVVGVVAALGAAALIGLRALRRR
ncbi:Protein/nucleic acid deglycase 1 [Pseudoclavibacter triregionum]|nr:Protein/nucleic acid deglycase 1 [Pseudoclavibacter triregionum]